jgi:hypothetical protein
MAKVQGAKAAARLRRLSAARTGYKKELSAIRTKFILGARNAGGTRSLYRRESRSLDGAARPPGSTDRSRQEPSLRCSMPRWAMLWRTADSRRPLSRRRRSPDQGCAARTNRARSRRSISKGVMHLTPRPMHASGILIRRIEAEGTSWVTTVCPPACACATR